MSSLRTIEKRCLEDFFGMSGGYVINKDFTNNRFAEFFRENAQTDIYSDKYAYGSGSKANRLRAFWEIETDQRVGEVLSALLELAKYEDSKQSTTQTPANYQRCAEIIGRLLGRPIEKESTEDDFLKKDFGSISVSKLRLESQLLPILDARLKEAGRCLNNDAPIAAVLLCGSILEGILLGVAQQDPKRFNQSFKSPKDKEGNVKQFHDWNLNQFIDVAHDVGLLRLDVKKFSHSLRDFRNYIHPYEQLASGFSPDQHTAIICLQVLKAAIANLTESINP